MDSCNKSLLEKEFPFSQLSSLACPNISVSFRGDKDTARSTESARRFPNRMGVLGIFLNKDGTGRPTGTSDDDGDDDDDDDDVDDGDKGILFSLG